MTISVFDRIKDVSGMRLIMNENLTDKITLLMNWLFFMLKIRVSRTGVMSIIIIMIVDDGKMFIVKFITFIWSCTKFLAPKANGLLLSYKSKKPIRLVME